MSESITDLVELARSGSPEAFDSLVSIHQEWVFALAYRMLGNPEDASDIQQETFLLAWRKIRKYRGDAAFGTWLHRIALNLCLSRKRRKGCRVVDWSSLGALEASDASPTPLSCLVKSEKAATVRKALAAIPAHHRAVVILRDIEERPYEEIARVLGCSVPSVRSRLCMARKHLRQRLGPLLTEEGR